MIIRLHDKCDESHNHAMKGYCDTFLLEVNKLDPEKFIASLVLMVN